MPPLDGDTKCALNASQDVALCMAWFRDAFDPSDGTANALVESNTQGAVQSTEVTLESRCHPLPLLLSACGHVVCSECLHRHAVARFDEHGVNLMEHTKQHQQQLLERSKHFLDRGKQQDSPSNATNTSTFTYGLPCPHLNCVGLLSDAEARAALSRGASAWARFESPELIEAWKAFFPPVDMRRAERYEEKLRDAAMGQDGAVSGPRPCRGRGCGFVSVWDENESGIKEAEREEDEGGEDAEAVESAGLDVLANEVSALQTALTLSLKLSDHPSNSKSKCGRELICPLCAMSSCARCGRYPYHFGYTCYAAACADGRHYEGRASVPLAVSGALLKAKEGSEPATPRDERLWDALQRKRNEQELEQQRQSEMLAQKLELEEALQRRREEALRQEEERRQLEQLRALEEERQRQEQARREQEEGERRKRDEEMRRRQSEERATQQGLYSSVRMTGPGGIVGTGIWQCMKCQAVVERNGGCNSMVCRCGFHFCFVCGKENKTCSCPYR